MTAPESASDQAPGPAGASTLQAQAKALCAIFASPVMPSERRRELPRLQRPFMARSHATIAVPPFARPFAWAVTTVFERLREPRNRCKFPIHCLFCFEKFPVPWRTANYLLSASTELQISDDRISFFAQDSLKFPV